MKVTIEQIENILGFKITPEYKAQYEQFNLSYDKLTDEEYEKYLIDVINILTEDTVYSGEHRIIDWEKGWGENLNNFIKTKDIFELVPKYHSKRSLVRWDQQIIKPHDKKFDYFIHIIFVDSIIKHYFKDLDNIFEFGCGPAYHLVRLSSQLPAIKLHGSDWTKASQDLIIEINNKIGTDITGFNFNFFKPDNTIDIPANSGVYTIAALEQVGDNFKPFVDFLLEKNPSLCIHLEPIDELLDETNLIDNLSLRYFRKRNYLKGFLPYLEKLEREGIIEIIKKQRIFSGSYFIEGHSLIVWRKK